MDNEQFEKQRKNDNRKIIKESFVSQIKEKKKFDIISFLMDIITIAIAFGVADKIITLTIIESKVLYILFEIAIIIIALLIKEFIVAILHRRKK